MTIKHIKSTLSEKTGLAGACKIFMSVVAFLLFFPAWTSGQSFDQYVFPANGNYEQSSTMSLSWTLGDNFIETIYLDQSIFTQGFQQSFIEIREIKNQLTESFEGKVFPNPTEGKVQIDIKHNENYKLELLDVAGKLVYSSQSEYEVKEIDLSNYAPGKYFLKVSDPATNKLSLFEIIKF